MPVPRRRLDKTIPRLTRQPLKPRKGAQFAGTRPFIKVGERGLGSVVRIVLSQFGAADAVVAPANAAAPAPNRSESA